MGAGTLSRAECTFSMRGQSGISSTNSEWFPCDGHSRPSRRFPILESTAIG